MIRAREDESRPVSSVRFRLTVAHPLVVSLLLRPFALRPALHLASFSLEPSFLEYVDLCTNI